MALIYNYATSKIINNFILFKEVRNYNIPAVLTGFV